MKRRDFLKLSIIGATAIMTQNIPLRASVDISKVRFNANTYHNNSAQVIMIFLYGGPSELAGNLTNFEEIEKASLNSYNSYFGTITKTANNFWAEAGGDIMEDLISSRDLNIFRTCYSIQREKTNNKAHGKCVAQNLRGEFKEDGDGIFTKLAQILQQNGVIDQNSVLPFVTMEGESAFFARENFNIKAYLKPVALDEKLNNPYKRESENRWFYYTSKERQIKDYHLTTKASLHQKMDNLAQSINIDSPIKEAFSKRAPLSDFIKSIKDKPLPDGVSYPENNIFANKLQTAIKILSSNPDTKILSLGSGGLGGWDEHNDAKKYLTRMKKLFSALNSAITHLKAEKKDNKISIIVFGDFGRNVNLNNGFGWDHGNNQNVYILGGSDYFNHVGVVGETKLYNPNKPNRLFLRPKQDSYQFEPLSVASTIYKVFGIENPEVLTGGYGAIEAGLF